MARKFLKNNRLVPSAGQEAEECQEPVNQYERNIQRQEHAPRRNAAYGEAAAAIALRIFLSLGNGDEARYQRRRRKQKTKRAAPSDGQASYAETERYHRQGLIGPRRYAIGRKTLSNRYGLLQRCRRRCRLPLSLHRICNAGRVHHHGWRRIVKRLGGRAEISKIFAVVQAKIKIRIAVTLATSWTLLHIRKVNVLFNDLQIFESDLHAVARIKPRNPALIGVGILNGSHHLSVNVELRRIAFIAGLQRVLLRAVFNDS